MTTNSNEAAGLGAGAVTPRSKGRAPLKKPTETKANLILKRLRAAKGVTLTQLTELTGWQAHSVRGFLSAIVRKKLGFTLTSETDKDGARRYRIQEQQTATAPAAPGAA